MRITRLLTFWVFLVPMSVFLSACVKQDSPRVRESPRGTSAIAIITNKLPVDGCSYPVTINDVDYAPDAASLVAIRDRVPAGGELRARINYRLTGLTGRVECGFGTSRELPEIAFRVERVLGQ
jgi:hypothetical protein